MAQTITVVISPTGEIGFFAEDGTFKQGKENIAALLAAIESNGATFDAIGTVEKHRHTKELADLHDTAHL